uniref:Transposase-associated domain-containing protein n=1 Tax=Oryza brachyantha TaxID=4533 RepID=J3N7P0_ORYBR
MPGYDRWIWHGEGVEVTSDAIEINEDEHEEQEAIEHMFVSSPLGGERFNVDRNALDAMLRDVEQKEYNERDYEKFTRLVSHAETSVYPECKTKYTTFSTILELMKLKASNGWKTSSIDGKKSKKGGPAKVFSFLPIVGRVQRVFANSKEAKLVRWHDVDWTKDSMLRHPVDSVQWRNINNIFLDRLEDPRNIRFGLSTDGPKHPGNDIDVFLQPLVDDLHVLWGGVDTWDVYGEENFQVHVILFNTINDWPSLGNLSGQTIIGKCACSECMEETHSWWFKHSRKMVYMDHRRFFRWNPPYRSMTKPFNGKKELREAPRSLSGDEVYNKVEDIENLFGKRNKTSKRWVQCTEGRVNEDTGKVYLPPSCYTLSDLERKSFLDCISGIKFDMSDNQDITTSAGTSGTTRGRPTSRNRLLESKLTITVVDLNGNPTQRPNIASKFDSSCGVVPQECIGILHKSFKEVSDEEKELAWEKLKEKIDYSPVARVDPPIDPTGEYPQLTTEVWKEFLTLKNSLEFVNISDDHKRLQARTYIHTD